MRAPDWWATILLALAAFRTWKLLAEDDILNWPRRRLTRMGMTWEKEGDSLPDDYRFKLAEFMSCPWCLGFWLALGWWGLWEAWPHGTLVAASVFAISALVPLADRLTSE